jgi:hypothetical protein
MATSGSVVDTPALLWLTLALYIIGGHIGFPLVLITTTLLKKSSRHPTFLNLCLAWILSSISFSILFYFNRVMPDSDQPEFWVCLLQASAVLVSPILLSLTMLAFVLNLWLSLKYPAKDYPEPGYHAMRTWILLAMPHVVCLTIFIPALVYGAAQPPPDLGRPANNYFCIWPSQTLHVMQIVIICASALCILLFEFLIAQALLPRRSILRVITIDGLSSIALFIRVTIFVAIGIAFVISTVVENLQGGAAPMLVQASLSTIAFLAFGTRPDLYRKPAPSYVKAAGSDTESDTTMRRFQRMVG